MIILYQTKGNSILHVFYTYVCSKLHSSFFFFQNGLHVDLNNKGLTSDLHILRPVISIISDRMESG